MTKRKDPADLKPRGRPRRTPDGAARRSILCTADEYAWLMAALWRRRESPEKQAVPTKSGESRNSQPLFRGGDVY